MTEPTPASSAEPVTLAEFEDHMSALVERLTAHTDQATRQLQKGLDSLNSKVDAIRQSITGLAKKIELPSSQSNGEDFPLDEPTSKEVITLSINDKEPEVEAGEILDKNHISKTDVVPQKNEHEDRTEQSILEEETGSTTDGEPQLRMTFDQGDYDEKDCSANSMHVLETTVVSPIDQEVYMDTGQVHEWQEVGHLRLFDLHGQVQDNYEGRRVLSCEVHDHTFVCNKERPPEEFNQLDSGLATRHPLDIGKILQLNYQLNIPRSIRGFLVQFIWISDLHAVLKPTNGFAVCGLISHEGNVIVAFDYTNSSHLQKKLVCDGTGQACTQRDTCGGFSMPPFQEGINSSIGGAYCDFSTEPIYDEDYMLVHLSHNHIPQEFNPNGALDMVLFHNQCVAIPDKTMHYDMIVDDKADLSTVLPIMMQLKIMLCQMTKMLGGQQGSPYELPSSNFQMVAAQRLCSTLGNFQQQGSHAGNITASRLGVKHWWLSPWPYGG